jgi:hypothetical protein
VSTQADLADSAIRRGAAGRAALPADLRDDHGRILQAFTLVEQGKDEEARTLLQGVALRSPFAEWRLFLRGLQAYHAGEDTRAIEVWARLAVDRLPFRLAAPFRACIDPAFRDAQTPRLQQALRRQFDSLAEPDALTVALRNLHQGIARQRSLARHFAAVQKQQADLRALPPDLLDRLARSLYWALMPAPDEERLRFKRTFPVPREDPKFLRLAALAQERNDDPYSAIELWQAYEKQVAGDATLWGPDSQRVRALLWVHMGQLASIPPEDLPEPPFDPWAAYDTQSEEPLQPPVSFADCFQKARKLAPDLAAAYILPVQALLAREEAASARPLAVDLRKRFPDSVDALMTAAMVFSDLDELPEAVACAELAARINPLDQRIQKVRRAYALSLVLYYLRRGQFPKARAAVATARLLIRCPEELDLLRIQEATISWKEGDTNALPALRAELAPRMDRAGLVYTLVIQANAAKVDRKSKAPLDKEFADLLAGDLSLAEAMTLGRLVHAQGQLGAAPYVGYKTHRTRIIKKLAAFTDDRTLTPKQYLDLGQLYRDLGAKRPLGKLINHAPRGIPRAYASFLGYLQAMDRGWLPLFGGPPWELNDAECHVDKVRDEADRAYLRELIEREKKEHNFGACSFPCDILGAEDEDDFDEDDFP